MLHRISSSFTGAVDSVPVAADGTFRFPAPRAAAVDGDVHVVSFRHQGILYFGEAVDLSVPRSEPYAVQAYPARPASAESPPTVHVRNFLVRRAEGGLGWSVTDLFEIDNSTGATLVASEEAPAWSHALPPAAANLEVGQGDLAPEAATLADGRVHASAPILPGTSVFVLRYDVLAEELAIPLDAPTESMELLLREPAGEWSVAGLAALDPVEMNGATYRRFAGRGLAPSEIRMSPASSIPVRSAPAVAAFTALLLALVGAVLAARSRPPSRRPAGAERRRLVAEIARLDEAWSRGDVDDEDYRARRSRLIGESGS